MNFMKLFFFRFETLEFEFQAECTYDYVDIYEGNQVFGRNSSNLIGTFCGNMTSPIRRITSVGNVMTVEAITDYSEEHGGGFSAVIDFTLGIVLFCFDYLLLDGTCVI